MMTIDELKATLESAAPPGGLPQTILALWHDARGDWDAARVVPQRKDCLRKVAGRRGRFECGLELVDRHHRTVKSE